LNSNSDRLRIDLSNVDVFSYQKLIEEGIDFSDFSCENKDFEIYLKDKDLAIKDDLEDISKLWLFVHMPDKKVVGYVTLVMSQLSRFQHNSLMGLSRHDNVPGVFISEMARDIRYKQNGIGGHMIDFVANIGTELSRQVDCKILIVEALGERVSTYEKFGFTRIKDEVDLYRNPMFLRLR
jgi:ribosomal protein S18 acetylase RimI-like enzyme